MFLLILCLVQEYSRVQEDNSVDPLKHTNRYCYLFTLIQYPTLSHRVNHHRVGDLDHGVQDGGDQPQQHPAQRQHRGLHSTSVVTSYTLSSRWFIR